MINRARSKVYSYGNSSGGKPRLTNRDLDHSGRDVGVVYSEVNGSVYGYNIERNDSDSMYAFTNPKMTGCNALIQAHLPSTTAIGHLHL